MTLSGWPSPPQMPPGFFSQTRIGSGDIGSGAIWGYTLGWERCISSGSIGWLDIADAAIRSGNLGSGVVASGHFASGLIAALGSATLLSGQVSSGFLGNQAAVSGTYASGSVAAVHLASGSILAGVGVTVAALPTGITIATIGLPVTSGSVTSGYLGNECVVSGSIASGQVASGHLASGLLANLGGAVQSGAIQRFELGSGAVNSGHIGSGAVTTLGIASGAITANELGSGAVGSGTLASGQVGFGHLANASVHSGTMASGAIATFSRHVVLDNFVAAESVSGSKPLCICSGGGVAVARGASGLRMPCIGVGLGDYSSGQLVSVVMMGFVPMPAAILGQVSGQVGRPVYLSSSGHLITRTKPTVGLSQRIGVALSGGLLVQLGPVTSGQQSLQSGGMG